MTAPPDTSAPFRLGYRPGLDGVRAVAVLWVMSLHIATGLPREGESWAVFSHVRAGYLGVDVFLVLSGFLITSLLVEELRDGGRIDLRNFYARRAIRLLPALFALLGLLAVVVAVFDPAEARGSTFWKATAATVAYVGNWFQMGLGEEGQGRHLIAHTWSLSIEEQFYLVWPLLVTVFAPRFGRRLIVVAGGLTIATAAVVPILSARGAGPSRLYFATDTRVSNLLMGATLAMLAHHGFLNRVRVGWARLAAGGCVALFVALTVSTSGQRTLWRYGLFTIIGLATAALIVWLLSDETSAPARWFASRPMVFVGRLSYSLYLWHWPVWVLMSPARTGLPVWLLVPARLVVALVVSWLSFRLVEKTLLPLRHRFAPRPAQVDLEPAIA